MPGTAVYYDSCIFIQAFNKNHPEGEHCAIITTPDNIHWDVCICSRLICSETTGEELLEQFQVACASLGIIVCDIDLESTDVFQKKHQPLKRTLSKKAFGQRDWRHLMCAVCRGAKYLCSVDPDFWDPANKSAPKAKKKKVEIKKLIEKSLPIAIVLPSELVALSLS